MPLKSISSHGPYSDWQCCTEWTVTIKLSGRQNKIKNLAVETWVYMYWSGNACYKINVKPHKSVGIPIHFQGWKNKHL